MYKNKLSHLDDHMIVVLSLKELQVVYFFKLQIVIHGSLGYLSYVFLYPVFYIGVFWLSINPIPFRPSRI